MTINIHELTYLEKLFQPPEAPYRRCRTTFDQKKYEGRSDVASPFRPNITYGPEIAKIHKQYGFEYKSDGSLAVPLSSFFVLSGALDRWQFNNTPVGSQAISLVQQISSAMGAYPIIRGSTLESVLCLPYSEIVRIKDRAPYRYLCTVNNLLHPLGEMGSSVSRVLSNERYPNAQWAKPNCMKYLDDPYFAALIADGLGKDRKRPNIDVYWPVPEGGDFDAEAEKFRHIVERSHTGTYYGSKGKPILQEPKTFAEKQLQINSIGTKGGSMGAGINFILKGQTPPWMDLHKETFARQRAKGQVVEEDGKLVLIVPKKISQSYDN